MSQPASGAAPRPAASPVDKAYKPWLVLSTVVFVVSLFVLAAAVTFTFIFHASSDAPIWVILLGALALLGIFVSFAALVLMLSIAGYRSFRESRRVQVLPPVRPAVE